MTYTGRKNNSYTVIEPAVGKGGEGSVYKIAGMPDYVLKIFNEKNRTETKHGKLLAMLSTPLSEDAIKQTSWPVDVVYENGQFVGYVLPVVEHTEQLSSVFYDENYSLDKKIYIALNLCVVINSLHNAGQVCGDLNPHNICFDPATARVTMVDTDSFHIKGLSNGNIYRCEIGMVEYLPVEVQNKIKNGFFLSNAPLPTFTVDTDNFALAILIFKLLMNGCHPFACAIDITDLTTSKTSAQAPQPMDNICNGFFPFIMGMPGITTPKYAPSFNTLPKDIQDLFTKAFVDGHNNPSKRPTPVEWHKALSLMAKNQ